MNLDAINFAGIVISLIAATGAILSQRASSKASTINTATTSRVEMEKEAYIRARDIDTETIRRQDVELEELRTADRAKSEKIRQQDEVIDSLRADNRRVHAEVQALRTRIARLERGIPQESEEQINERWSDSNPAVD